MSEAPTHIHLDAVGGVAGDMFAGALLHALPHLTDRVLGDCRAVLPPGADPQLMEATNGGIAGRRLHLSNPPAKATQSDYAALRDRISAANLSRGTADAALAVFAGLAEAEATIHGVPIDTVHFHEVGDWDSLMDVVAAGSVLAALPKTTFSLSPLPLGSGNVATRHGRLPVPAPATTTLLTGFTVYDDGVPGERITPTGAAILRQLPLADRPSGEVSAQGFGLGTRTLPGLPNMLRVLALEAASTAVWASDSVAVIEFDIDDMTGEELAEATDRLRAITGVLDISLGARAGKQGRPVTDVRILATPNSHDDVAEAVFDQTATLGFRSQTITRCILPRAAASIPVNGEPVAIKRATRPSGPTQKVEARAVTGATLAERRRVRRAAEDPSC